MIGFTSRTFNGAMAKGAVTLLEIVRWASAEHFAWMEVRDGKAALTEAEVVDLKAAASEDGLKLHYAWDGTNILDPSDFTLFQRGIANSARMGAGTFSRITIAGRVIKDSTNPRGYTDGELETLRAGVERYIRVAGDLGVRLVFENSHEPLSSMRELLAAVPSMLLTFDPGNLMDRTINRSFSEASEVKRFYRENAGRIPYVHAKTTKNHIVVPALVEDGDIEPGFYRGMISEGKLVCIELPEAEDLDTCRSRILESRRILNGTEVR